MVTSKRQDKCDAIPPMCLLKPFDAVYRLNCFLIIPESIRTRPENYSELLTASSLRLWQQFEAITFPLQFRDKWTDCERVKRPRMHDGVNSDPLTFLPHQLN